MHRSDESGTTDNFTKYLSKTAESRLDLRQRQGVEGPGRHRRQGSDGVAAAVKSTAGTIAYVELSFAENSGLKMAKIKNGAGEFAELTGESAGKTIAGAKVTGTGNDLKLTIDYATNEAGAYPIVLVTYEIACSKGSAEGRRHQGLPDLHRQHRRPGRARPSSATPRCRRRSAPRSRPRSRPSPDHSPTNPSETTASEQMGDYPSRSASAGAGGSGVTGRHARSAGTGVSPSNLPATEPTAARRRRRACRRRPRFSHGDRVPRPHHWPPARWCWSSSWPSRSS